MKLEIALIEINNRHDGHVTVNGFDVKLTEANLIGSEKQVAWAKKVIIEAARHMVEARFNKLPARPYADQADNEIATINAFFAQHMQQFDGSKASDWIDLREYGWMAFSVMSRKLSANKLGDV